MKPTRTFDLLDRYQSKFNKENAFAVKRNRKWTTFSTQDYIDQSYAFCYGLSSMGFKKGDKIASVSNNRPEWNFIDMGMSMIGVVHVPLYTSLSSDEYESILKHSEAKILMVSDKNLLKKLKPIAEKLNSVEGIFTFDEIEGEKHWSEIVNRGNKEADKYKESVEKSKSEISEEDFAALIYTSGTTGASKGVMLSHKNLVRNFLAAAEIFDLKPDQKYLSILPLCHVGGRMGNYQTQYSGCSIYYAENMGTIARDMADIKPDGFDAVPRILEKIFDNILNKGKALKGMKKKIFFWAVKVGLKYKIPEESSWFYKKKLSIADKLIFSKWRAAIGGNVKLVGCGGAALQARVERIFWAAGIKVLNMYGLTETSPVITINRQKSPDVMLGSVGALIDGVEMKLAEDGEILCKGHNVMLGYYKDPDMTKQVFTEDGWFKTGDIGTIEKGKFLKVTDRKKEIFKLSSGKFIVPQSIENKFKESMFIDQMIVVGEHEKFASAIIAPDYSYIKNWCKENNIADISNTELIKHELLTGTINKEIQKLNSSLSEFERIKRYKLIPDVWSSESGELSATLKLKRRFIFEKYSSLIDEIYVKQSI
jgi:long-chain acyl-CoA synthetase